MEKQTETISFNEDKIKTGKFNNIHFYNKNINKNNMKQLLFNAKMTQVDLHPFKTITPSITKGPKLKKINQKLFNKNKINNNKEEKSNNDILNLKYSFNKDNSFNSSQKNLNNSKSNISYNIKEEKSLFKSKEKIIVNNNKQDNISGSISNNKSNKNNNSKKEFPHQRNHNARNFAPLINRQTFEIVNSGYTDKSLQNWNDLKKNYIEHVKNQEILKKYEKQNLTRSHFNSNNYRKFYFGRKNVQGLPYYYDVSSTYMNSYQNKSEHNRHEILIDEFCKLRAYLLKYKIENSIEVIKDFLIKHNMPNMNKYTNYQLIQFGRFICQEDIYKINSLLKPYMHIKDMINDILENSENLIEKFNTFKFNSSIKNLLANIKTNKSQPVLIRTQKNSFKRSVKPETKKNKKFYISELDYIANKSDSKNKSNNNISQNEDDTNKNSTNYDNIFMEDEKKVFENNRKDFSLYSRKRKEILKNIGVRRRHVFKHVDTKETYFSPLFNNNTFQKYYRKNNKKIKLPKISNNLPSFYKPNKLLLSPDKNYSLNFGLLFKDLSNEINNFQNDYERKFDMDVQRDLLKNLPHSKSCENLNNNIDILIKKKLENNNRLYFGKKNIKVDFEEIQRKHKLTEYIALINAKNHIKDEIINDNVINY